jgi:glycosyltransferase involved in cell wall biosynthesis
MVETVETPSYSGRPRVLAFAYACEPGRGSEPGAGWGILKALAEFAECVVLVGPEHVDGIERWHSQTADPWIRFIPVAEPRWGVISKRHRIPWFVLYLSWLRRAHLVGQRLHRAAAFDVLCHVTYSTYWLPTPATRYGVPSIWGPVGGAVTTPVRLWPLLGSRGVASELLDLLAVRALSLLPSTRRTWREATVRLVQNEATRDRLPSSLRPTVRILNHALFADVPRASHTKSGSHCIFLGALESRKGGRLALRALAFTPEDVSLKIVGDGKERGALERLAHRLRVSHRVEFHGRVSRAEALDLLSQSGAAVFTGLREEGGMALAEAMLLGVPVVVLGNGGAHTLAASATDASRVALIAPSSVEATAQSIGEAMTRFCRRTHRPEGGVLDQARARQALRNAFDEALAGRSDRSGWASDPTSPVRPGVNAADTERHARRFIGWPLKAAVPEP